MVSKASEDLPEPESPVKTIRRSRGSSSETFFRLCSRAPRMVRVSAMVCRGYRRSPNFFQLPTKRSNLIAQASRVLEAKLHRGEPHLGLEGVDEARQLLCRQLPDVLRKRCAGSLRRPPPGPARPVRGSRMPRRERGTFVLGDAGSASELGHEVGDRLPDRLRLDAVLAVVD